MMSEANWVWKENNFRKCPSAACEGGGGMSVCARGGREGRGEHGRNFSPPVSTPRRAGIQARRRPALPGGARGRSRERCPGGAPGSRRLGRAG